MENKPVRVAMVGVGAISGIYLKSLTHTFQEVELIGVCDLIPERAEKRRGLCKRSYRTGSQGPRAKDL